ncbi:DUF948 domain-containing protein [Aquiluna borgnonia]|jgi:uncharacterized protein YoxC|uniref:DUF948 domain-containing protein n=1 Tax=Aquiluna borgnonia TaxID=2499157 RepID=A0A7D4PQS4_9MICO|nr:DUF948 domain-containing protein [Aquiluna borgnonia]QKJ25261.1 DUF948 domain-containing protein [Aquiluna borgnonia]
MSGGEVVGIIFALSFAVLVLFIGFPLVKLGKVLDESARTIKSLNAELEPMLQEARVTMAEANKQLKRIDAITEDVEQVTENINGLVAVFTASIGGPLTKLFGVTKGLFTVMGKRR